jgi:hypothetical protein
MRTFKDSQFIKDKDYIKSLSEKIKHGTYITYHVYKTTVKAVLTVYTQESSFALYLDEREAKTMMNAFIRIESVI